MQEIKCPNCGQVFQVDESGYAQIVQQVRDKEFELELKKREAALIQSKENDLTIARLEQEQKHKEDISRKEAELAEKERSIDQLKAEISGSETAKELAVSQAVQTKEK